MKSEKHLTPALYLALRQRVLDKGSDADRAIKEAADRIAKNSQFTTPRERAWHNFGDKPLFPRMSSNPTGPGARYAHMWKHGMFDTQEKMAAAGWSIGFRSAAERGKGETAYFADGPDAAAFNDGRITHMNPEMPGYKPNLRPKVAYQRLHKMRKIAMNLDAALSAIEEAQPAFKKAVTPAEFLAEVEAVSTILNIGVTTAFHGLADMGYEVIKPDIHVTRTLAYFGHLADPLAFTHPNKYMTTNLRMAECVCAAVTLARQIPKNELLKGFKGNACREVDIVLMQASKLGCIPDSINKKMAL